jgi:hypothetical protein
MSQTRALANHILNMAREGRPASRGPCALLET